MTCLSNLGKNRTQSTTPTSNMVDGRLIEYRHGDYGVETTTTIIKNTIFEENETMNIFPKLGVNCKLFSKLFEKYLFPVISKMSL
jgi:hypothetical protein